ncbi:MAG: hypothetical protein FJW39_19075 [Acidobacteria bacterium]|nr:hypothetical protein [Acidobacteriota bacterium]
MIVRSPAGAMTLPLALYLLFASCSQPAKPVPQAKNEEPSTPSEEGQRIDDAAKFLAGIKGRAGGAFQALEEQDAWVQHNTQMEQLWASFEKRQLGPAVEFYKRELAPLSESAPFVFYPFGGPDAVYVTTFYPNGKLYVLAGLEPPGSAPQAEIFNAKNLAPSLGSLRESVGILRRSFFVTSEMDKQFRGRVTDGLTPVILLLLARTGHTIFGIRHVNLTPEGQLEAATQPKPKGVEILFRRPGDKASRKMYYFSGDVRNPKLEEDPGFLKFVEAQGRSDTFIKSASFLLHWREFTAMRDLILRNSNAILQDDSGVPFRVLKQPDWQMSYFGKYSAPDRPFKSHFQKELHEAFEAPGNAKALGFSLGYGYGRRTSHLVFARRTKASTGSGAGAQR